MNKTFGCTRFVWNQMVENFNNYKADQPLIKITEKILKENPELDWLKEPPAAALQQTRIDFDGTKRQFFNKKRKVKIGRMQYKGKGIRDGFRLPFPKFKVDMDNRLIYLEKFGWIHAVFDRFISPEMTLKSVTIRRNSAGKFFASILIEREIELLPLTGQAISLDLGLNHFATTDTGEKIENPKWFRENQSKLKRAQRALSRKVKGSNRYNEQRQKVAKIHEDTTNKRKDFHHKLSTYLVKNFDTICIEDLNIKGMTKSNLAKSVHDVGWGEFVKMLDYKSDWYGKCITKVDRFYPSSQICSSCEDRGEKKPLDIRSWTCKNCGTVHDRDINAARNILRQGLLDLGATELYRSSSPITGVEGM